jgi:hypothetical protein
MHGKVVMIERWGKLGILFFMLSHIGLADVIDVELKFASVVGNPGSAVTFDGTLTNTSDATVFLTGAGLSLAGFAPENEDTTPFFADAPFSLGAGFSTSPIDLFTINVPEGFAPGAYQGGFTILGGVDAGFSDIMGSTDFTVQVNAVPEPRYDIVIVACCLFLVRCSLRSREHTRAP